MADEFEAISSRITTSTVGYNTVASKASSALAANQPSMLPFNVFHILRNFVWTMGCNFSPSFDLGQTIQLIRLYDSNASMMPVATSDGGVLVDMARRVDQHVRKSPTPACYILTKVLPCIPSIVLTRHFWPASRGRRLFRQTAWLDAQPWE